MKRILIIDDAEFARYLLRNMLEEKGYEVCGEAEDGPQGIEKFKQLKPDLTICDIRMHEMNGADCIKQILSEDANARILVCAAINTEETMDKVLKLGVKGVIQKPVSIDELANKVQLALSEPLQQTAYKELMEERAKAEGVSLKSFLDFCTAFKSISGYSLDDPHVDQTFLAEKGEGLMIGMRALLSSKVPLEQLGKLEQIFEGLI